MHKLVFSITLTGFLDAYCTDEKRHVWLMCTLKDTILIKMTLDHSVTGDQVNAIHLVRHHVSKIFKTNMTA